MLSHIVSATSCCSMSSSSSDSDYGLIESSGPPILCSPHKTYKEDFNGDFLLFNVIQEVLTKEESFKLPFCYQSFPGLEDSLKYKGATSMFDLFWDSFYISDSSFSCSPSSYNNLCFYFFYFFLVSFSGF